MSISLKGIHSQKTKVYLYMIGGRSGSPSFRIIYWYVARINLPRQRSKSGSASKDWRSTSSMDGRGAQSDGIANVMYNSAVWWKYAAIMARLYSIHDLLLPITNRHVENAITRLPPKWPGRTRTYTPTHADAM